MRNNDKNIGTKSNKISKVTPLWRFIIDRIDECQEIKRLSRYMTKTPLDSAGTTYDNKTTIRQINLTETLLEDVTEGDKVLYDNLFDPEMKDVANHVYIFVYPHTVNIAEDSLRGSMYFGIDVLCNVEFDSLARYGEKRIWKIAEYITEILDSYVIEDSDKICDDVGNVIIKVVSNFTLRRVSKTNNILVLSIPVKVEFITARGR